MNAPPNIPALSKTHDWRPLSQVYARFGRIHIPAVLTPESAARVHRCLTAETPYSLVVNNGSQYFDIPAQDQAKMSPEQRKALADSAVAGAQRGFQLFYENHRLTEQGEPYPDPNHYLAAVVAFLNSPEFLFFIRAVTGEPKIAFADAQATRYGPGHFLTTHDDGIAGKNRVAGYILNMTPQWLADWGGNLLFLNKQGHITEGYVPAFNALNLLRVPQPHCVSHVAPFAGAYRYSITGWFRTR
ncbi:MAG TPA: 2OG-Fe(II) oxygenase family protein [Rhizomicrobium sp.]|jgi:Rps23 Pro-64 3,4-dihydroxylase Tpa1-like proline 4-hydroxylase